MRLKANCLRSDETGELIHTLARSSLPTEDVNEQGRSFFRFEDDEGLVGFGGWEGEGRDRLLRSLVVVEGRQRQGLGSIVLAQLETEAKDAGADRFHLLTTTAASFFRANGYRDAERVHAPRSIQDCEEFKSLCPASASYLVKELSTAPEA
ncbi:MAG TPA: arsenic resistance N-acetyltransferase ArsN2 [Allosphingosinicella sp.]|uniref:arsenic resistance N-acetyltransferase ArsN2 n=1 Tax=Allosphingosinicella sp. TaxID=2823234 RepID=UPI002ED7C87E